MVDCIEIEIALIWSIKKETFMKNVSTVLFSESIETSTPGYEYYFAIKQEDGYVAIFFQDSCNTKNTKIKELTVSIPSANFMGDLSKRPDVPKDHHFYRRRATVAIKSGDILNHKKNFFVDGILTLEFCGIIECNAAPNTESLGKMLWKAKDKDFTFIIGKEEIKAHKFILRQYSSVFAEMFDSNINQIEINGFGYSSVHCLLNFCYDVPIHFPSVDKLLECLRFADIYNMPVIKEKVSNKLVTYLNTENVCEIANKSLEFNAPTLKGYCISYISKCKRDGKQYSNALNLNTEIVLELYKSSLFRTETT